MQQNLIPPAGGNYKARLIKIGEGIDMLVAVIRRITNSVFHTIWSFSGSNVLRNILLLCLITSLVAVGQQIVREMQRISQAQEIMSYATMKHLQASRLLDAPPKVAAGSNKEERPIETPKVINPTELSSEPQKSEKK